MVELIVVLILAGILAAVGASRYFIRTGFDVAGSAEQIRALLRYAQKLAIAQNRNVYVTGSAGGVALCYANSLPCPAAQIVAAPGGSNSASTATTAFCVSGGYVANWACEGFPSGVTLVAASPGFAPFYFNGLGKPFLPGDLPAGGGLSQDSSFATTSYSLSGDGVTVPFTIYQETGYVD